MWTAIRKSGEADYDTRMEYVAKGEAVAAHWAHVVKAMQKEWRGARTNRTKSDRCSDVGDVWKKCDFAL
jgi:hypothetical protein